MILLQIEKEHPIHKPNKQLLAGLMRSVIHCDKAFVWRWRDVTVLSVQGPPHPPWGNSEKVTLALWPQMERIPISTLLLNLYSRTQAV